MFLRDFFAQFGDGSQDFADVGVTLGTLQFRADFLAEPIQTDAFAGKFGTFLGHLHFHFAGSLIEFFVANAQLVDFFAKFGMILLQLLTITVKFRLVAFEIAIGAAGTG